jgi:serine/threonine protein kinase
VWALGVILVNLTCGRNPWKRDSLEDSTFRAYLKDPFFLQSILPLSTEAVVILSRIFERDPSKRITITELRSLIVDCPRFTTLVVAPEVASSDLHPLLEPPVQELDLLSFSPGSSVVIGGSSNGSS